MDIFHSLLFFTQIFYNISKDFYGLNLIKIGNFTVFLPIEIDDEIGIIRFLLSDEINKKIVKLLFEHDTIKKSDTYKLLNEKRELVYYRINNLIEQNIIDPEEEGKKLRLNPNIKNMIDEILRDNSDLNK